MVGKKEGRNALGWGLGSKGRRREDDGGAVEGKGEGGKWEERERRMGK